MLKQLIAPGSFIYVCTLHFAAVRSAHQSNVMENLKQVYIPSFIIGLKYFWACPLPCGRGVALVSAELRAETCSVHALFAANASHQRCKKGRGQWHEPSRWRHGASSRQFALNCCHLFRLALSTEPSRIIFLLFEPFFLRMAQIMKIAMGQIGGMWGQGCGYKDCYI